MNTPDDQDPIGGRETGTEVEVARRATRLQMAGMGLEFAVSVVGHVVPLLALTPGLSC